MFSLPEALTNIEQWSGAQLADKTNAIVTAIIASGVTLLCSGWWSRYVSGAAIRRHEAFERVNISLNYFDNDTLRIRTIVERPLEEVIYTRIPRMNGAKRHLSLTKLYFRRCIRRIQS